MGGRGFFILKNSAEGAQVAQKLNIEMVCFDAFLVGFFCGLC